MKGAVSGVDQTPANSVHSKIVNDGLLTQSLLLDDSQLYPADPPLFNEIDSRVNIDKARQNKDYYKDFQ